MQGITVTGLLGAARCRHAGALLSPVGDATDELLSESERLHHPRLRGYREPAGERKTKVVYYWLPEGFDDDVRPSVIPESAHRLSKRPTIVSTSGEACPQPKVKRTKRPSSAAGNVLRRLIQSVEPSNTHSTAALPLTPQLTYQPI